MAREGKAPAFPWYAGDWLADADVRMLSLAGRGALVDLISFCWREGSIPDDGAAAARMMGVAPRELRDLWPSLRARFDSEGAPEGRLVNRRLEDERAKQADYRSKQATKGRASGAARGTAVQLEANRGSTAVPENVNQTGSTAVEPAGVEPEGNLSFASAFAFAGEGKTPPVPVRDPVPPRSATRVDPETAWLQAAGMRSGNPSDCLSLRRHVDACAMDSGRDADALYRESVAAFVAYQGTCTAPHIPQLAPHNVVKHWAAVWGRVTGTAPTGAATNGNAAGSRRGVLGMAPKGKIREAGDG